MISTTTRTSPFFANYGFYPRLGIEPAQPCPPDLSGTRKREFYKANVVADRFDRILTQLKHLLPRQSRDMRKTVTIPDKKHQNTPKNKKSGLTLET